MAGNETAPVGQRPARGMYVLPSAFTCGNIAAGYYAVMQAIAGAAHSDPAAFDRSALAIVFAILFDGLDGRVARMTNTQSSFGRELDSLADVIAFGVAPSLLAYLWGVKEVIATGIPWVDSRLSHLGLGICFCFLICGACRLARFNVSVDPMPKNPGKPGRKYFVGMPIPAGAWCVAAVVHFEQGSPIHDARFAVLWMALIGFVGFLMVSSWRFWSGKEIDTNTKRPARLLVLLVVTVAIVVMESEKALIVMAMAYLVSGVIARLAYSWQKPEVRV